MVDFRSIKTKIRGFIRKWVDFCFQRNIRITLLFVFLLRLFFKSYREIKLLPIVWLDEDRNHLLKVLNSEEYAYSYGPQYGDGVQCIEKVRLPSVNLYYFENAKISIRSSSILFNSKIIIERIEDIESKRCDFSSGHVYVHNHKSALIRNPQVLHIERGLFLGGNGASNYYHWMIEILPKLNYLHELDNLGCRSFPLLVSEDVCQIKTFHEALILIARDKPVVFLEKDKTYCISKLIYINAPNNLPFNLRQNEKMRITDFLTRSASINFLRSQLNQCKDFSAHNANKCHRILFARRNERRNYNQQKIFEIFAEQGFQKVFMEELSLKEQISLISNAEIIAGPTGAEWTNLIFCREGTKCLCWMAEGYGDFSAFSNLARIVGADLRYVTFKSDAMSVRELYRKSYLLDIKIVSQELEKILNTAS